ncbi:MAG TPA: ABC transporter permease, partial [Pyrinomonadaceae bacterium]|nr:ABC transporter permease [Pyrinomonadaceae bacterium]
MRTLLQDIKFGCRALAKNPGFTAVAVLALALGVGANSAIFSVVNATLLNALPFPEEGQLLRLGEGTRGGPGAPERGSFSYPDYKDVQAQAQTLAHVSAFLNSGAMLTDEGLEQERVYGADVSPEYFDVLGVAPQLGRVFTAEEDRPSAGVVVISHGLWQRRFGGRRDVVGRQMRMGNTPVTVIGVMPEGFEYPFRADRQDFWEPLNDRPAPDREQRDNHSYRVIAR